MSRYYIIVIPEAIEIEHQLSNEGCAGLFPTGQYLDDGIKILPAWHRPIVSREEVLELKNRKGDSCYCCLCQVTTSSSFEKALKTGELPHPEVQKQFTLYMNTTKSILQHDCCGNGVLVYTCKDVSELANGIFDMIQQSQEPVTQPIDAFPNSTVTMVAEGLAHSYYYRRITKIGPKMADRIMSNKYYQQSRMPIKVFIMIPYSCKCDTDLNNERMKVDEKLKLDNKKGYIDIPIFALSTDPKTTYYACAEYCSEVQVMYDMEAKWQLGLSPIQKAAELRILYEILEHLLTRPSAPAYCSIFKVVYYNDSQSSELSASEILVDEIQECLEEEKFDNSSSNDNFRKTRTL